MVVDVIKDKHGQMIGEKAQVRERWKEHFEELLGKKDGRRQ